MTGALSHFALDFAVTTTDSLALYSELALSAFGQIHLCRSP